MTDTASTPASSVFDRLAANDAARRADAERRRLETLELAHPSESAAAFSSAFNATQEDIARALNDIALDDGTGDATVTSEGASTSAMDRLREVNARIVALDRFRAEASYYLPSYDERTSANALKALREQFTRTVSLKAPREKFRFKSRALMMNRGEPAKNAEAAIKSTETAETSSSMATATAIAGPGTRDRANETIVIDALDENEDYVLERLVECDVYVLGAPRALRAHDLNRCNIYVVAVGGSVHVENIIDSVIHLAARQLRVHAARRVKFYIRTLSRPIIEDSRDVAFAPFAFDIPGRSENTLKKHGLFEETGLWREVDDFMWLKSTPSPHWRVLDEAERAPPPTYDGPRT